MTGIESLFTANTPKSVNYIRQGGDPVLTREEKLFILGQVQHLQPVGAAILTAQIAQCKTSRGQVVGCLQAGLVTGGLVSVDMAYAIAECATAEVCDSSACKICNGSGAVISVDDHKLIECNKCKGVGRDIKSQRELHAAIVSNLPGSVAICRKTFIKKYYDIYMDAVDLLQREASKAAGCARFIADQQQT